MVNRDLADRSMGAQCWWRVLSHPDRPSVHAAHERPIPQGAFRRWSSLRRPVDGLGLLGPEPSCATARYTIAQRTCRVRGPQAAARGRCPELSSSAPSWSAFMPSSAGGAGRESIRKGVRALIAVWRASTEAPVPILEEDDRTGQVMVDSLTLAHQGPSLLQAGHTKRAHRITRRSSDRSWGFPEATPKAASNAT